MTTVNFDKQIVKAAFPGYRGRKISSEHTGSVSIYGTYWDGGSRNEFVAVELATMRAQPMAASLRDPVEFGGMRGGSVVVPEGFAIVEHSISCGKDVGCRVFYAAPVVAVVVEAGVAAELESGR